MPFVVDASIATAWVVADEQTAETEGILVQARREGTRVPDLFWHEMRNILLKTERQGRITSGSAEMSIAILRRLPISVEVPGSDVAILDLARTHHLSTYDASCLALAIETRLHLATLDRALAAAARACGVALLGPLTP